MDHLRQPLEALHARAGAFVGDRDARLLYVAADADLAEAALRLVAGVEWHPDNRRPVLVLTTPFLQAAPGWAARTEALRAEYQRYLDAFDRQAVGLPPLPPMSAGDPLEAFVLQAQAAAAAFTSEELGTTGVLLVLAPESVDDPAALAAELRRLAAAPALKDVRWVWIQALPADGEPEPIEALGDGAWLCPCRVDPAREAAAGQALLAGLLAAVSGGLPPGSAGPRTPPPPHPGDPPAAPAGSANAAAFLVPFLKAVQLLRAQDLAGALPLLQEARALALGAGRPREATEAQILLATSLAHAELGRGADLTAALPAFETAIADAEAAGLPGPAAKAALVLGTLAQAARTPDLAATSFVRAATLANTAKLPALEFQALRLAGEVGVTTGARERGAIRLKEAVAVVVRLRPADARAAGLHDGARELAALCEAHGLDALAAQARAAVTREA